MATTIICKTTADNNQHRQNIVRDQCSSNYYLKTNLTRTHTSYMYFEQYCEFLLDSKIGMF